MLENDRRRAMNITMSLLCCAALDKTMELLCVTKKKKRVSYTYMTKTMVHIYIEVYKNSMHAVIKRDKRSIAM